MANLEYLKAKTTEYAIILSRINKELQALAHKKAEHQWLINYLQDQLKDAQISHKRLKSIVNKNTGQQNLLNKAVTQIHLLEYSIYSINYNYLPALQKENSADLALRELLLSSAKRLSMFWVKDIIICSDEPLAIIPSPPEYPIIFSPPQQAISLLEIPGLYHELGHDVFQKFEEIDKQLYRTVSSHFNKLSSELGRLNPESKDRQKQKIKEALEYWNTERLNEIFCDIFGTFTCGIAHYISCIDMGIRFKEKPYDVDFRDEHPPLYARVYACYQTLTPTQRKEKITIIAKNSWNDYTNNNHKSSDFNLICAEPLLKSIVKIAILTIQELLPDCQRYETPLIDDSEIEKIPDNILLEDILNQAAKLLLNYPERYEDWETKIFKALKFSS
ncbi:hypothetical protein [Okeania sp. KiyG1]|uniref:hypothetical protein n=1 Tax=Okeania sp. KiyG1 TaxID=2720165 RepID=UPI0019239F1E|nr:hypothetical protein [Okeania sp. KiyG1]GGA44223.1 hypothetical protein CYANOKiyG1_62940 [Okeania sp. KiyG1]